jgi:hypothetical protein
MPACQELNTHPWPQEGGRLHRKPFPGLFKNLSWRPAKDAVRCLPRVPLLSCR